MAKIGVLLALGFAAFGFAQTTLDSPLLDSAASDDKTLVLRGGSWFLDETLILDEQFSGLSIIAAPGAKPVISGGVPITNWKRGTDGVWSAQTTLATVRQLYAGLQRLPRARTPNTGWLRADQLSTLNEDIDRDNDNRPLINEWRNTRPYLFAGMRFREADADILRRISVGATVQTISAWESAWQPLRSIDMATRDMQLFTPSRYPLVHWDYGVNEGGGTPYAIENSPAGLDQPGEWYFDATSKRIHMLSEDKPRDIIAAQLHTIMRVDGAKALSFRGITFAHSLDTLARNDSHRDWPAAMRAFDPTFPEDIPEGITVAQSAPDTGDAIVLTNASNLIFENCEVRNTGGWGMWIGDNT
ncbi:MAG: hypothetical protein ACI8W8_004749, partial [Rhodothermales bacterium]